MNQLLHDHVRSARFSLSLSERQIETLLVLNKVGYGGWLAGKCLPNAGSAGVVQILKLGEMGLIAKFAEKRGWHVTKAGQLVSELLFEAGYDVPELYKNYKGDETDGAA